VSDWAWGILSLELVKRGARKSESTLCWLTGASSGHDLDGRHMNPHKARVRTRSIIAVINPSVLLSFPWQQRGTLSGGVRSCRVAGQGRRRDATRGSHYPLAHEEYAGECLDSVGGI
jgi:hypothetical protein